MPIEILPAEAIEKSTYVITAVFRDEDDELVIPSSITWTLTDEGGTVINERQDVSIDAPASSVDIVLYGDDLSILTAEAGSISVERRFTIEAVYDSDLGSDLPLRNSVRFRVRNLVAVE